MYGYIAAYRVYDGRETVALNKFFRNIELTEARAVEGLYRRPHPSCWLRGMMST